MRLRLKLLIFAVVFLYVGITLIKQEFKLKEQIAEKATIEKQIAQAKEQNQELNRQIAYTKSDEYVEKVAREQLGWVKKGEIKYMEKKD